MPIRPEWRAFYGRTWRHEIRPMILARAGSRCERCGKPDRRLVWTVTGRSEDGQLWMRWCGSRYEPWRDQFGRVLPLGRPQRVAARRVRVILTVAHLNHDPADNRPENLAALCQWCHLMHDRSYHRATRQARKDARRPLLSEVLR